MQVNFSGFPYPESNYSKLPHCLIDALPRFRSLAELTVVLYVLRHTWGFQEFDTPKRITTDEFSRGRRRRDRSRMDHGTGLSPKSIRLGIRQALEDGFLLCYINRNDRARIKKSYALRMNNQGPDITATQRADPGPPPRGLQSNHPEVTLYPSGGEKVTSWEGESNHRSEKETLERKTTERDLLPTIDKKLTAAWETTKQDALTQLRRSEWNAYTIATDQADLVAYDPATQTATILSPHPRTGQYLHLLAAIAERAFGQPLTLDLVTHWQPPLPERTTQ